MNYTLYHLHSDYSLLDSCTQYKDYIDKAVELGMKAIAFSEHGRISGWFKKMQYCKSKGIKYLHAVECYLTESLTNKVRDNYHTVLIARNYAGFIELNKVIGKSFDKEHFYYVNRISFDEFLNLSGNIITTSACLASPLNKLDKNNPYYEKLLNRYDYLEIQPHDDDEQRTYNIDLAFMAEQYGKKLIAGTDTHSLNQYKADCRKILMKYKKQSYGNEDNFDLTFKTYDELVSAFTKQNALPINVCLQAIENTNELADMVEEYEIDCSNKYPLLYGSKEADHEKFVETINRKFQEKIDKGIIPAEQIEPFKKAIDEELKVFTKIGMDGFMLSMSEILDWCHSNGIVTGTARGSVGGSRIAYITDIIDLNPETWHTVFSRFANENRVELGDIDTDVIEEDRPRIFEYVINRFGRERCARVSAFGTIADKAAIDEIGGALREYWDEEHPNESNNPYSLDNIKIIKKEYGNAVDALKKECGDNKEEYKKRFDKLIDDFAVRYREIFTYYRGMIGTKVSQSVHPAGMIISPIDLTQFGVFDKDGDDCLFLDMDECHDMGLVKYDFLCLSNVKIIKETCEMIGKTYPKSNEINWSDENVWKDMLKTSSGIFQMESDFAFQLLCKMKPTNLFEMSHITAAIRPAGASYRDNLVIRKVHDNGSELVNDLLKDNLGYLIYQEDVTKFLQDICGFSGSEADTMRRAIAKKKLDWVNAQIPKVIDGYCAKSDKPRAVAEKEAQSFIKVMQDAGDYMFGYNHSIAYCMIGYICAYLRYYHPVEFITALLNNAKDQDDTAKFTELAHTYGISIVAPKFGTSLGHYTPIADKREIAKGISSIKGISNDVAVSLKEVFNDAESDYFTDVLLSSVEHGVNSDKIETLIKIDFFDKYGNSREVNQIYRMFKLLGGGKKMSISKSDITNESVKSIVGKYTNFGLDSKGRPSPSYKFVNGDALIKCMHELELMIKDMHLADVSSKLKIANYVEVLGYVPPTERAEDKLTLIVIDITPIKSKNGQIWQYRVNAQSLGSGKVARLSLSKELYNNYPIKNNDVIKASNITKDEKGYWHLANYTML